MQIRNYKDQDFPRLVGLLKATNSYYEPLNTRENLKRKIGRDPNSIIILEDDKKLVGTVFIIYDPLCSFIYHLSLHPDYQKRGFGKKLMDEAEKRLKEAGIKKPTLFVTEDNKGVIDFYKKRGWSVMGKVFDMKKEL
ncbi:GNAT family N-acetyltransferase [Candidatus Woesearchaeota archaeon]|nr:GNAT family N-acetyltransferase [Candidatus Woesearchaeota archaeon]